MNNLEQPENFPDTAEDWNKPDTAEDWNKISESFTKANAGIEVVYTGVKKAEVPEDLARDGKISVGAKALYMVYFTYVYNQSPGTFVGRRTLAEHLGVCLKSISNWTKELEGLGWITVSRGQKKLRVNGNPVEIWSNIVELHDKPEKRK